MSHDLVNPSASHLPTLAEAQLIEKTANYERASLSSNTLRTYLTMWKKFHAWCCSHQRTPMPASSESIALFLADIGENVSFSTIDSVIAAIEKAHEHNGHSITGNTDLYRRVRKGIRRSHKENQLVRQAKALSPIELTCTCRKMSTSLKDLRDKALITLTFFGALRRSEAVSLNMEHLEFVENGVIITLLQTKTSDTATRLYLSATEDASICPILALKNWINATNLRQGPLFCNILKGNKLGHGRLSGHAVAIIMKEWFGSDYSGHSLRRGVATAAAERGASVSAIQQLTRHKSADMVLRYIERIEGFKGSSAKLLSL